MTMIFNMHEAKTNLSKLVELVEAGEEVQIARAGVPVVTMSKAKKKSRPLFGEFEPILPIIPEGFDVDGPLPEWEEALMEKDRYLKPKQTENR
jgi:antitoxin (DNA-binding transcriptional repressor) of toxin-antitoxin stability system